MTDSHALLRNAIDPFHIEKSELVFGEVLGKGAFGYVTEGLWTTTNETCAIKSIYIPQSARESGNEQDEYRDFLNETNVLVKVRHFNVLHCMGWSSDPTNVYVVTEFMPYQLDKLLQNTIPEYKYTAAEVVKPVKAPPVVVANTRDRRNKPPPIVQESEENKKKREAEERRTALRKKLLLAKRPVLSNQMKLQIAIDVAEGMNYLHTRNVPVVHRDLKSDNVLLDENLTSKIADFGLAKLFNRNNAVSGLKGTAGWLAPEAYNDSVPSGEMVDIYSYGMVLYELITHVVPFHDTNNESKIMQLSLKGIRPTIETEKELRQDDILNTLIELHYKCTELDPNMRPTFSQICKILNGVQLPNRIEKIVDANATPQEGTFHCIQEAIQSVAPEILVSPKKREPRRVISLARAYVANVQSTGSPEGESLGVKNKAKLPISITTDGKRTILPTRPLNPPIIKIMPGIYSVSDPILLDRNVHLVGTGEDVILETEPGRELLILSNSLKGVVQNITFRTKSENGSSAKIRIQGNDCQSTFTGCNLKGVQLTIEDGADPFITKCRIVDSSNIGIRIHGVETKGTIMGNDISQCKMGNIYVDDGADPVIEKNNIHHSGSHGIVLGRKTVGYIIDNMIYENAASGIRLEYDADPIIETNVIHKNEIGIQANDEALGRLYSNTVTENKIKPEVVIATSARTLLCADDADY
jgi:parallel beta-helix repeat protein